MFYTLILIQFLQKISTLVLNGNLIFSSYIKIIYFIFLISLWYNFDYDKRWWLRKRYCYTFQQVPEKVIQNKNSSQ